MDSSTRRKSCSGDSPAAILSQSHGNGDIDDGARLPGPAIWYGPLRRSAIWRERDCGDGEIAGQNRDEFIAAPAANIVAGAHVAAEAGRQLLQHLDLHRDVRTGR